MEYVGLSHSSQLYGKKQLLYCEMELLSTLKRYTKYKKLRKHESALKNLLKRKISQLKTEIKVLDKLLPKIVHKELLAPHIKMTPQERKHRSKLEDEIDDIKEKLKALNAEE